MTLEWIEVITLLRKEDESENELIAVFVIDLHDGGIALQTITATNATPLAAVSTARRGLRWYACELGTMDVHMRNRKNSKGTIV